MPGQVFSETHNGFSLEPLSSDVMPLKLTMNMLLGDSVAGEYRIDEKLLRATYLHSS